jgi:TusA-related sulfurtransferase
VEHIEFDIRGQICPSTLLTALKEINRNSRLLSEGKVVLSFKADNRDAVSTIPESAANMGYTVTVDKRDGYYVITVKTGKAV